MAGVLLYPSGRCSFCMHNCHRAVFGTLARGVLHHHPPHYKHPSVLSSVLRLTNGSVKRSVYRNFRTLKYSTDRLLIRSSQVLRRNQRWLSSITKQQFKSQIFRRGLLLSGCGLLSGYLAFMTSSTSQCQSHVGSVVTPPPVTTKEDCSDILMLQKELSFFQQLKLTLRFAYLCLICSPVLFLHAIAYISGRTFFEKLEIRYILYLLQATGPAFIKLGQWASTRRDIFSEEFCNTMSCLHTHCDPHSWPETAKLLEESFGEDWEKTLVILDHNPIGSGCVAQVYQGYLRLAPEDRESPQGFDGSPPSSLSKGYASIAVKVLHPGVVEAMDLDIRLMTYVASWIDFVYPDVHWIALKECVNEFAISMQKQLDLEIEAKNLSKFNVLMTGYDSIKFPTPLYPYVTKSVLVESFEQGDHISEYLDKPGGNLQKTLAKIGIEVLLDMMFVHNFVHGDLHPGNILVQDPLSDDPKLVLVDCGIATSLGSVDLENFYKVFKAIVKGDGVTVADLFLGTQSCQTLSKYRQDMAELVDDQIQHLNLTETQVSTLFSRLFSVLVEHKVRIESKYTSVMVAFMVIEGVARSLDPTMDIMVYAKPCILQRTKFAIREQLKQTKDSVRQKLSF